MKGEGLETGLEEFTTTGVVLHYFRGVKLF